MDDGERDGAQVSVRPGRRRVLVGLLTVTLGLVGLLPAGCTGGSGSGGRSPTGTPSRTPSPDEQAAGRAAVAALTLLAQEALLAQARPSLRPVLDVLAGQHRAHLVALGVPAPEPSTGTGSPSGTGSPTGSPRRTGAPSSAGTRGSAGPSPADVVLAERRAATEALADVPLTSAGPAGLLARIAAARAVHADLLAAAAELPVPVELPTPRSRSTGSSSPNPASAPPGATAATGDSSPTAAAGAATPGGTGSPDGTGSPSDTSGTTRADPASLRPLDPKAVTALSTLVSAEHAAVFGYGLLTARVPDARQPAVRALWVAHRARRDELERRLADAGATPPAALPGYDVGPAPTSPSAVTALGARIEDAMASAALSAVVGSTGEIRSEAALDLIRAARRATGWRGSSTALPG